MAGSRCNATSLLNKVLSLDHHDAKRTLTLCNRDCVALRRLATLGPIASVDVAPLFD